MIFNVLEHSTLQYTKIRKKMESLVRYKKIEEKILAQNTESYISIRNSLIKALTSKKAPVREISI